MIFSSTTTISKCNRRQWNAMSFTSLFSKKSPCIPSMVLNMNVGTHSKPNKYPNIHIPPKLCTMASEYIKIHEFLASELWRRFAGWWELCRFYYSDSFLRYSQLTYRHNWNCGTLKTYEASRKCLHCWNSLVHLLPCSSLKSSTTSPYN